ncbi:probable ferric reduction oxidase 1 [Selaginella moellendorffii]|uniref:probable ferric reduction oxidase 1 n=1 Tax=Selaginella moellendorffii TaxID=88036 RepID=UPI000D1C9386|nr:probable ferric reduction oxidase 1 [Selaginella moellendorffii]|eukprot:XP_024528507.1 probable ferric reduction oxidase 1 [Selaginella moellendorffii]
MKNTTRVHVVVQLVFIFVFAGWIFNWIMLPTQAWYKFWGLILDKNDSRAYGESAFFGSIYMKYIKMLSSGLKDPCKITMTTSQSQVFDRNTFGFFFLYRWLRRCEIIGYELGYAGLVPFAFLFFPVARTSSILHLVNIPFEHSVKYHIWVANITLVLWTGHSVAYLILWILLVKISIPLTSSHGFWFLLFKFINQGGRFDLAGIGASVAFATSLIMWITAIKPVRNRKFEMFFYTHQLYIVFIFSFAVHAGDRGLETIAAGMVLFFVDRLLRYLQSRRHVDMVSAKLISSDMMELAFAKDPSLRYPASSIMFLNIPAVSKLQWHPFTVTTNSNVDDYKISVVIKSKGSWTKKLRNYVTNPKNYHVDAIIEGPYGHSLDYLIDYSILVFVAGGSGITPFIPILKEVFFQIQTGQRPLPEKIELIWTLRNSDELSVLESVSPWSICPDFSYLLNLQIHAYLTRQDATDLKNKPSNSHETILFTGTQYEKYLTHKKPKFKAVTGTQSYALHAAVILASFGGYLLLSGVIRRFIVFPLDHNVYHIYNKPSAGTIALLEYLAAVVVFGGSTAVAWTWWKERRIGAVMGMKMELPFVVEEDPVMLTDVHFGCRPDYPGEWKNFFSIDHLREEFVGFQRSSSSTRGGGGRA